MTHLEQQYVDPRLVALYDLESPRGIYADFYLQLSEELDARRIVDLGCGTGQLTRELAAAPGRQVIGVDPSEAMLAIARGQPGAERVEWIEGDASAIGLPSADLVIMTGNVAQVFLDDDEWAMTLAASHGALRPGGHIAFESRNPDDRGWERWNRDETYAPFDSPFGPMETWLDGVSVDGDVVRFEAHNLFVATGEDLVVRSQLRFRGAAEIAAALLDGGFTVESINGDWKRGPLLRKSRAMVFVARR